MRKILLAVFVLIAGISILYCAGGSNYAYYLVQSTGLSTITLDKSSTEIYVIKTSTPLAYINWTSTTASTSDCLLDETDDEFVFELREEVVSSKLSVWQPDIPAGATVYIRIQAKSW